MSESNKFQIELQPPEARRGNRRQSERDEEELLRVTASRERREREEEDLRRAVSASRRLEEEQEQRRRAEADAAAKTASAPTPAPAGTEGRVSTHSGERMAQLPSDGSAGKRWLPIHNRRSSCII